MWKVLAGAIVLAIIVAIAFTQCAGPSETPKSPSYLPQR
jgi:hypothetical protein